MYSVSDEFLEAVQSNTRTYDWTGTITTTGGSVYTFGYEDIVKGSGLSPGNAVAARRLSWGRCTQRN